MLDFYDIFYLTSNNILQVFAISLYTNNQRNLHVGFAFLSLIENNTNYQYKLALIFLHDTDLKYIKY